MIWLTVDRSSSLAGPKRGRIPKAMPIDLSNLAFLDKNGKASRVGFKVEDGKKVRFAKTTADDAIPTDST